MNQVGEQAFASFFHSMYSHDPPIHPFMESPHSHHQNDTVQEEEIVREEFQNDHVLNIQGELIQKPATTSFLLSFSDLNYSIKLPQKFTLASVFRKTTTEEPPRKIILKEISGEARHGEILALLGTSGSGKSTLIDALANRIDKNSLKGKVTLNGEVVASRLSKAITAYVMQDDLFFPMLTVQETLTFAAEFRLPRKLSHSVKKARVEALIDQLGLRDAANTIIGDEEHRGVSGGERRRVSIGIDIIHDPIVLFLDEPTSGLDSTSAYSVVNVLKGIAESGSVVVMSIHQPSYRIVGLLNRVIFLSKGEIAYTGSPSNLPLFFSDFGRPIPENTSPIEFALDLISELENSTVHGKTNPLVEFNSTWQQSQDSTKNDTVPPLKDALKSSISKGKLISSDISNIKTFANPFWKEILILSKRSTINSRRTSEIFATRLLTVLTTGFLLATIYFQLDESPKGIRERLGFFAFAISTTYFSSCQYLPVFIQERHIFIRETAFNAYRRSSYAFAHTLLVLPPLFVLSLAFSAATFIPVGLAGGLTGFLTYFAIISAAFWAGNSFAVFVSGVVPHVLLGYTVVLSASAYFLLLSGFFIVRDRIPPYWLWLHYGSLVKYPYEAVMRGEFGGDVDKRCFVRGIEMFENTPFGVLGENVKEKMLRILSEGFGMNVTRETCLTNGLDVLKAQRVSGGLGKWWCLVVVVGFGFFYRFLFYVSLLFGSKNKRK